MNNSIDNLFDFSPYKNVTIFDGVDACQSSEWKIDDYEAIGDGANHSLNLPRLKPFTQYALYIKTYTIASERKGAQSDIIYFTTKPDSKIYLFIHLFIYKLIIKYFQLHHNQEMLLQKEFQIQKSKLNGILQLSQMVF